MYYKMDYEAWDEGTFELTLEDEAAYLRLCHQMYRRNGPIPNSKHLLCRLFRCHHTKAAAILKRLILAGKIYCDENGALANKRVTRELDNLEMTLSKRRTAGHKGGISSGVTRAKSLNGHDTDEAHASMTSKQNEAKERRGEESTSSSLRSEEAAVPAADLDPRTVLFRHGLVELAAISGRPEGKLRPLLGRWLKASDDDPLRVLSFISKAKRERPAEPIAWIEAHIQERVLAPRRARGTDSYGQPIY